jgi:hypothetical protein
MAAADAADAWIVFSWREDILLSSKRDGDGRRRMRGWTEVDNKMHAIVNRTDSTDDNAS